MPLFIFDHDCVDHSICIWSQDGAAVMSCSWLNRIGRCGRWSESALMVVMGHFCWPWPGAVGGARDTGHHRQCSVGGHAWEGEMMPTRSRCLCEPTLGGGGRGGPGRQGRLRGSCVFSWPSLREYSHMDMTCGGYVYQWNGVSQLRIKTSIHSPAMQTAEAAYSSTAVHTVTFTMQHHRSHFWTSNKIGIPSCKWT